MTGLEQMVEWLEEWLGMPHSRAYTECIGICLAKARSLQSQDEAVQEKEEGLREEVAGVVNEIRAGSWETQRDIATQLEWILSRHPSKATEDRATGGFVEFVPDCSDEFERWVKTHFFGIGEKQIIKAYRKLHPVPSKATEGMALASFCHTCKTCAVREGFPCNNPIKPGNPPLADKLVEAIEEYFDYLRDTKGELHPKAKEILAKFKEAK